MSRPEVFCNFIQACKKLIPRILTDHETIQFCRARKRSVIVLKPGGRLRDKFDRAVTEHRDTIQQSRAGYSGTYIICAE